MIFRTNQKIESDFGLIFRIATKYWKTSFPHKIKTFFEKKNVICRNK